MVYVSHGYVLRVIDFIWTVMVWFQFLIGYLVLLPIVLIPFYIIHRNGAAAFQRVNHLHFRAFFAWIRFLMPHVRFDIPPDVRKLRSSIIVCNHVSYLDPILLISLYERQTTIVKSRFFQVPVFGWFLRKAGYVPSSVSDMTGPAMIGHLEGIRSHLAAGGNVFVFPEGTRSRDGQLAPFNKGVFSIARYCKTGLKLMRIEGTDQLFEPGRFAFHSRRPCTLSLHLIAEMSYQDMQEDGSIMATAAKARRMFESTDEG